MKCDFVDLMQFRPKKAEKTDLLLYLHARSGLVMRNLAVCKFPHVRLVLVTVSDEYSAGC